MITHRRPTALMVSFAIIVSTYSLLGVASGSRAPPTATKLSFKPPQLTEEEELSEHMPDNLKCEACQAIAYQLQLEFGKAESKSRRRKLTESQILEVTDKLVQSGFEMYGIKGISGDKHLTGPGLATEVAAGIVQMGGKWPKRLRSLCGLYLGEVGEDVIYHVFNSRGQSMADFLCHSTANDGARGRCSSVTSPTDKEL